MISKTEEIKNYIQYQLTQYINKPSKSISIEDITEAIIKQFPLENPNFDFTIKPNEYEPGKIDIVPHNLYTGVFLQEGLLIDPTLKEVSTLYGKYTFENNQLLFSPDKKVERVEIQVTVKE